MDIYVGNLAYEVRDSDLVEAFKAFGTVEAGRVVMDRDTGRSRGFGFVTMPTKAQADAAIAAMNGKDLKGRVITVNESKPREGGSRPQGGGGGSRSFGGGGPRW